MSSPQLQPLIKESTQPNPPRYRWLRRSLAIFVILSLMLTGLWFWWAHVAAGRLQAAIDEVHARGEPINMEEFIFPAIPDKENGAVYYSKAHAAALQPTQIDTQWIGWDQYWSPTAIANLGTLIDGETVEMGLIRQARGYPKSVWPVTYKRPAIGILLPHLNWMRQLANTQVSAVFVAHQRGQDDQAVEYLRDMHHFADSAQQYGPFLVSFLVASGIDAVGSHAAMAIARDLKITDAAGQTTQPNAATRRQIMDLIAELSDESQTQLAAGRATWGERMMAVDPSSRTWFGPPGGFPPLIITVLGPSFDLDAATMIRFETQIGNALTLPTHSAALAAAPVPPKTTSSGKVVDVASHLFASILAVGYQNVFRTHFRMLTDRRAAVIALAVRLYRYDHNGAWPNSLNALIPNYLPAIPIDPFSPTGSRFKYLPPIAGSVPKLYSVGEDGIDNGGKSVSGVPSTPGWTSGPDFVYDLIVPPITTQPSDSSETGKNAGNK